MRPYLNNGVTVRRRKVQCDALTNLANDELVRVVSCGHVIHVVDVAERDDLGSLAGEQVRDRERFGLHDVERAFEGILDTLTVVTRMWL